MQKIAMIIDDETQILSALKRELVREGWQVVAFSNPTMALQFAQSNLVPLVIADYSMPEMTGVEFFRHLDEIQPVTYKIMLSGCMDRNDVVDAVSRGGVHVFLEKPWDAARLTAEMKAGLDHFKLLMRMEFALNREVMPAEQFRQWYEGVLTRFRAAASE